MHVYINWRSGEQRDMMEVNHVEHPYVVLLISNFSFLDFKFLYITCTLITLLCSWFWDTRRTSSTFFLEIFIVDFLWINWNWTEKKFLNVQSFKDPFKFPFFFIEFKQRHMQLTYCMFNSFTLKWTKQNVVEY